MSYNENHNLNSEEVPHSPVKGMVTEQTEDSNHRISNKSDDSYRDSNRTRSNQYK